MALASDSAFSLRFVDFWEKSFPLLQNHCHAPARIDSPLLAPTTIEEATYVGHGAFRSEGTAVAVVIARGSIVAVHWVHREILLRLNELLLVQILARQILLRRGEALETVIGALLQEKVKGWGWGSGLPNWEVGFCF